MSRYTEDDVRIYHARRNAILTKLQVLSDGGTSSLGNTKTRRLASSSTAPGEVIYELSGNEAPPKDQSLFGHFRWRFKHEVRTLDYGHMLCTEAERDYAQRMGWRGKQAETVAEMDGRVLRNYKGYTPDQVALWENCEQEYVIRLRAQAKMDPETGREVGEGEKVSRRSDTPAATAEELIFSLLAAGPQRTTTMQKRAATMGVSWRMMNSAKSYLDVESFKEGDVWYWRMAGANTGAKDATKDAPICATVRGSLNLQTSVDAGEAAPAKPQNLARFTEPVKQDDAWCFWDRERDEPVEGFPTRKAAREARREMLSQVPEGIAA